MPQYSYTAVDARGQQISGVIEAASEADASSQIRQQGYFPTRLIPARTSTKEGVGVKKSFSFFLGGTKVKTKVLTTFTRQLATLIEAGLPLVRGMEALIQQERNRALHQALVSMKENVESGSTFSEALAQHPKIFSKLFVNMVRAGEVGGVLEVVLKRLAEFQEKAERIRGKILSATVYPVVVLAIAALIVGVLMVFVVPKFQQIFNEILGGKELPWLTQMVINVSHFIQSHVLVLVGGIILVVLIVKYLNSNPKTSAVLDAWRLKLPIVGPIVQKTSIARFTRTLGTLVSSGVPILQALNITKDTVGNHVVAQAIVKVHDSVKEGESVVVPLESSGLFPAMVISMVRVGEETGRLPEMLIKVADVYEEEVDNAVSGLTSLLEPLMIVFLAVVVGIIVIALFMPLIGIIEGLSGAGGAVPSM
ncbi:MAG: type II secretion system F family protein [Methylacidiphilales bacterium]|nr:type II secretion system F family protein [Candidatus Methylacidiphilales bacterium]MDW8348952.1 type II secretion system F family protein [Verrucomicrobiae bacterium]